LKVGLPAATAALGSQLGIPPAISGIVGKIAGDVISKEVFGKGVSDDVIEFKGGVCVSGSSKDTPQKRRARLVKKVMVDRNVKLPEASRIIKEENLPY
jgi:hypothetical protein